MEYSSSDDRDLDLPAGPQRQDESEDVQETIEQYDSELPAKYQVFIPSDAANGDSGSTSDENMPGVKESEHDISYINDEQPEYDVAPKLSAFDFEHNYDTQQPLADYVHSTAEEQRVSKVKSQQAILQPIQRNAYELGQERQESSGGPPQRLGQISRRPDVSMDYMREENRKRAQALREQASQRMHEIREQEDVDKAEVLAHQEAKRLQMQFNREKERQKLRQARQKHDEMMQMLKREQLPECTKSNLEKPNFFKELRDKQFPKPENPEAVVKTKDERLYYGTVVQEERETTELEEKYGYKNTKSRRRGESRIPRIPFSSVTGSQSPDKQPVSPQLPPANSISHERCDRSAVAAGDYGDDVIYEQEDIIIESNTEY